LSVNFAEQTNAKRMHASKFHTILKLIISTAADMQPEL